MDGDPEDPRASPTSPDSSPSKSRSRVSKKAEEAEEAGAAFSDAIEQQRVKRKGTSAGAVAARQAGFRAGAASPEEESLGREEIKRVLTCMGITITPDFIRLLFERFDMDGTGQIEYDEFLQMYKWIQKQLAMDGTDSPRAGDTAARVGGKLRSKSVKARGGQLNLKEGQVTWLGGGMGPVVYPPHIRFLIRIIMFQNAMALALLVFNFWQLDAQSE